jgi:hypothetical protein
MGRQCHERDDEFLEVIGGRRTVVDQAGIIIGIADLVYSL